MKGLPFSNEMAKAWFAGRKTVTRRLMKPQPFPYGTIEEFRARLDPNLARYQPGEVVYIQEAWHLCGEDGPGGKPHTEVIYRADSETCLRCGAMVKWKSAINMPEWASRSKARIVSVRPEQVRSITELEAINEGALMVDTELVRPGYKAAAEAELRRGCKPPLGPGPEERFVYLWESLYPGSWERNDWVFVYGLEAEPCSK